MKNLKAIRTGLLTAIIIFLLLVSGVVFLNIISDDIGGKGIQSYFTYEFVINLFSHPAILGVLGVMIILSCLNQWKIVKEQAHKKEQQ